MIAEAERFPVQLQLVVPSPPRRDECGEPTVAPVGGGRYAAVRTSEVIPDTHIVTLHRPTRAQSLVITTREMRAIGRAIYRHFDRLKAEGEAT